MLTAMKMLNSAPLSLQKPKNACTSMFILNFGA